MLIIIDTLNLIFYFKSYIYLYFTNVTEGMHLKSKILYGVAIRKILSFYHKPKRQLFYYDGTSSYNRLKIPECVKRVFLRIPLSCCFRKYPSRQKNIQSWQKRNASGMLFWASLWLAWRIFLKSVTESVFCKSSGFYINSNEGVCDGVCF